MSPHSPTAAVSWSQLCELAAIELHDHPVGPLDIDLVVVPSSAHQRAFSQYLAARASGPQITAGLEFIPAHRLERHLCAAFEDEGLLPTDHWRGAGLWLGILEAVADPANRPVLAPLILHLGDLRGRPGRGQTTASRLSGLFRRYARQHPDMVTWWRAGRDVGPNDAPLADRDRWQPALWRQLGAMLGPDPAERHRQLLELLAERRVPGLPARLVTLQIDDPAPAEDRLLTALSRHHEVHRFTMSGIPVDGARPGSPFLRHHSSRPALLPPRRSTDTDGTLLAQVQAEVRQDLPAASRRAADGSLQIHACHGPDRQVQVLRDVLCGLFTDDPTLQPRDVVVLCPALTQYAPLISAFFCLDGDSAGFHPGHRLRAQLAAPSVVAHNPVLAVLERLFALHSGRATSVDLMDLCQLPPVAQRFGFNTDELDRLHELVADAEIRWGVDADQRHRNGLSITQSTWLAGVERLMVSLAFDKLPPVNLGTVTPVSTVAGSDAELVGRLAELVSRVRKIWQGFDDPAPAALWAGRMRAAIDLLVEVTHEDEWQLSQALAEMAELDATAQQRRAPLVAGDLASWLADRQQTGGRRPNYSNGSLLFTTLDDVASIEARVICVLGLDDSHFPGPSPVDGDDLLTRPASGFTPHWTDRPRGLRRQRLLDALLAAREKFIVITQGADESTGRPRPAPICVSELVEACSVGGLTGQWRGATGPDALVSWHPMHPHGWPDFVAADDGRAVSFDRQALQGAVALAAPKAAPPPPRQWRHAVSTPNEVDIEELIAFFANPAKALLRQATGTTLAGPSRELRVELPLADDYLVKWQLGNEVFESLVAGHDPDQVRRSAWLGGRVLPGLRGQRVLDDQLGQAQVVATAVGRARAGGLQLVDCDVEVAGRALRGRVGLYGDRIVVQRFGHPKPDDALACWLRLALLSAAGRAPLGASGLLVGKRCHLLPAPNRQLAMQTLAVLIELREEGMQTVLPFPLRTAAAFAGLLSWGNRVPIDRAREKYKEEDANWCYFFPGFDDLVATGRFEALAGDVLGPIAARLERWQPGQEVG